MLGRLVVLALAPRLQGFEIRYAVREQSPALSIDAERERVVLDLDQSTRVLDAAQLFPHLLELPNSQVESPRPECRGTGGG